MSSEAAFINTLKLHRSPSDTAIIQSQWETTKIKINIILAPSESNSTKTQISSSSSMGFTGEIPIDSLQKAAKHLEVPFRDFVSDTKRAISTHNGLPDFQYECDGTKLTIWRVVEGAPRRNYGTAILKPNNALCFDLLRNTLTVIAEVKENEQRAGCELKILQETHSKLKSEFEAYAEKRLRIEADYLKKFAVMLNEKKRRIRELKEANSNVGVGTKRAVKRSSSNEFLDINDNKETPKPEPDQVEQMWGQPSPSSSGVKTKLRKRNQVGVTVQNGASAVVTTNMPKNFVPDPPIHTPTKVKMGMPTQNSPPPVPKLTLDPVTTPAAVIDPFDDLIERANNMIAQMASPQPSVYECETENILNGMN